MSEALSEVYEVEAPALVGAWLFAAADPAVTLVNYLHTDARTVSSSVDSAVLRLAGRSRPVVEYGEQGGAKVAVTILVPFGASHDSGVQWWRDALQARRTLCYRDGRGRLYWAAIAEGVAEADRREGTGLGVALLEVDYDEAVV
jgi:hypothetical protein